MSRIHTYTILSSPEPGSSLWQYSTSNPKKVHRVNEEKVEVDKPLAPALCRKNWDALLKKQMRVAWAPVEDLFLGVAHIPAENFEEARSMVELQWIEKLSPLPLAHVVWSLELLPQNKGALKTALVAIAPRNRVEQFLESVELLGFEAERLECPFVEELASTTPDQNGAWIYPVQKDGVFKSCYITWWFNGALEKINLIQLPANGDPTLAVEKELARITWAGEVEGWMTATPKWTLVLAQDKDPQSLWRNWILNWAPGISRVQEPQLPENLALRSASSVSKQEELGIDLMPGGFSYKYKQRFIDRVWMKGVVALALLYLLGTIVYLGALQVKKMNLASTESSVAELATSFTNTLEMEARIQVLEDLRNTKSAAFQCLEVVSTNLPPELVLTSFGFSRGKEVSLNGTTASAAKLTEYYELLSSAPVSDQKGANKLFSKVTYPRSTTRPGSTTITWSFECELNRRQ